MLKHLAVIVTVGLSVVAPLRAQGAADYPNRPVKVVVDVAPGGGVDTATRLVAAKLEKAFGQPFVVENRPGAGGNIGAEFAFNAEPDGYTLLASSPSPLAINQWLYRKLAYDPAGFQPIAMMSRIPNVLLVRQDFPAKTVQEFIAYVKAHPGELSFGSQGIGTASHLTGEMFMRRTGTKMTHVPYRGTAQVVTDIISGHIDLTFIQVSNAFPMHASGKARILAAATERRLEFLPDVPALAEVGLPISTDTWNAISAPPKTPGAIVAKLNTAINAALKEPDVQARLRDLKTLIGGDSSPTEVLRFVEAERRQWGEAVHDAGVTPQ